MTAEDADLARRFGGLSRLYGPDPYARIRQARIAVIGIGGVGSWAAEALARSGVAGLCLIDMDHIAESNINRQIHALTPTVGQAKAEAMRERIALIHPGCDVQIVDDFVDEDNVQTLLSSHQVQPFDGLIDCCDQVRAKAALAAWAWQHGVPLVTVGAAGGKVLPHQVECADLADVSHDPLLASLRQRLRQRHGGARKGAMRVPCVFSREAVRPPQQDSCLATALSSTDNAAAHDNSLNCHGYGSSVTVTATFGFTAAALLLNTVSHSV
jgi:tRNA threonylcarbamoyladenosine dehydratase